MPDVFFIYWLTTRSVSLEVPDLEVRRAVGSSGYSPACGVGDLYGSGTLNL